MVELSPSHQNGFLCSRGRRRNSDNLTFEVVAVTGSAVDRQVVGRVTVGRGQVEGRRLQQ